MTGLPKRPSAGSQCARILRVLEDGQPHPMREIHQRVGPCRLNSRISNLRRDYACVIVCDPARGEYVYQLVGGPLLKSAALAGDRVTTAPVPRESGPLGRADEPRLGSAARGQYGEPAPPPGTVLAVSSSVLPSRPPANVLAWRAGAPVGSPAVPSPGPRNDERAAGGQLNLFRGAA